MDINAKTDNELAERFLFGCKDCFEELVQRYETKVFNTALHLTSDVESAEKILEGVFTALYHRLQKDLGKTPLFEWLIQETLDSAVFNLVQEKTEDETSRLSNSIEEHSSEFQEHSNYPQKSLRTAITSLPEEYKHVFLLRDVQGLPLETVAKMLAMSLFEVRSSLHRARLLIRKNLETLH